MVPLESPHALLLTSQPGHSHVSHQTILVLDFGSQYTQLIARRLRELSVYSEILPFSTPLERIRERNPAGIILSGGPKSVSEDGAPKCTPAIFDLGTPVLGICYGMQLMTDVLGGHVRRSGQREFGHAMVTVAAGDRPPRLFADVPPELRVWASHGDDVAAVPPGFDVAATSATAPIAAMERPKPLPFSITEAVLGADDGAKLAAKS